MHGREGWGRENHTRWGKWARNMGTCVFVLVTACGRVSSSLCVCVTAQGWRIDFRNKTLPVERKCIRLRSDGNPMGNAGNQDLWARAYASDPMVGVQGTKTLGPKAIHTRKRSKLWCVGKRSSTIYETERKCLGN